MKDSTQDLILGIAAVIVVCSSIVAGSVAIYYGKFSDDDVVIQQLYNQN